MVDDLIFSVNQIKWMDTKEQQEFVSRLYNEEDSKLTAEFEKETGLLSNVLRVSKSYCRSEVTAFISRQFYIILRRVGLSLVV